MAIDDYSDLKFDVERHDGVRSYNMRTIRIAHGAGKLGSTVIHNIKKKLEENGLGWFPQELPTDQWMDVRIYSKAMPVGQMIDAVLDISPTSDALLRGMVDMPSRTKAIERLKEIVAEL